MLKEMIKPDRILVVGDFMLDTYWSGEVSRISPEAPVPVFQKKKTRAVAGGAANVVANLIAAGKRVSAASVIGVDEVGDELSNFLTTIGCNCELLQRSPARKTTNKTRLLAQNNQQLVRIDEEDTAWLSGSEEALLLNGIISSVSSVDAIILSDYMKGVLSESLCQKIITIAKEKNIRIFCDVKDTNLRKYKGATLLKPNKKELGMLTGMPTSTNVEVADACRYLCKECNNEFILVTLGAQGMALFSRETDQISFISSEQKEVYDVSGAGDTTIAYFVACVTSGIDVYDAMRYANKAGGIKVGKVGTSPVSIDEMDFDIIRDELVRKIQSNPTSKIYDSSELSKIIKSEPGKKVVFTNGCFDILHAGHVMYLQKAADYGDCLIVGVNSDESIRRLKGADRPINSLADRLSVLAALQSVTYLVAFDEDTPEELIRILKPDVLVKGADYEGKFIAGADFVRDNGGEVVLIPMLEGHSTTNIIKKSKENKQ